MLPQFTLVQKEDRLARGGSMKGHKKYGPVRRIPPTVGVWGHGKKKKRNAFPMPPEIKVTGRKERQAFFESLRTKQRVLGDRRVDGIDHPSIKLAHEIADRRKTFKAIQTANRDQTQLATAVAALQAPPPPPRAPPPVTPRAPKAFVVSPAAGPISAELVRSATVSPAAAERAPIKLTSFDTPPGAAAAAGPPRAPPSAMSPKDRKAEKKRFDKEEKKARVAAATVRRGRSAGEVSGKGFGPVRMRHLRRAMDLSDKGQHARALHIVHQQRYAVSKANNDPTHAAEKYILSASGRANPFAP